MRKTGDWMERKAVYALILMFTFWIRILVSLHPYSGAGRPPRYGDYEAQRHWMEISIHTPVQEWYKNTTHNDINYWGIDYPPLTGYQSFIHGLAIHFLEPQAVALGTSRGYESYRSKFLMRWTVLLSDAFIFYPAAIYFVALYYKDRRFREQTWALMMILLQPALILIDHGHFQYNCIGLGLSLGAVAAINSGRDVLASFLFCLSLNHKQINAYYAPAFFAYLLGKCLRDRSPPLAVSKLGLVVISTFGICWWPFLKSKEQAVMVLRRLAPLQRGIFEDYVANFWCGTSLLVKWKHIFSTTTLAHLALGATLSAILPSVVQQIKSPSRHGFLWALFNSSIAFYLFAYQVHEKSILFPLLPASLLVLEQPRLHKWITCYAMFSMFPLLQRDGLVIPYFSLFGLFFLLLGCPIWGKERRYGQSVQRSWTSTELLFVFTNTISFVFLVAYLLVSPPKRYPYLFDAFITAFAFAHFAILAVYGNLQQWAVSSSKEKAN